MLVHICRQRITGDDGLWRAMPSITSRWAWWRTQLIDNPLGKATMSKNTIFRFQKCPKYLVSLISRIYAPMVVQKESKAFSTSSFQVSNRNRSSEDVSKCICGNAHWITVGHEISWSRPSVCTSLYSAWNNCDIRKYKQSCNDRWRAALETKHINSLVESCSHMRSSNGSP